MGGSGFGQQYIPVVKEKIGRVNHIFEFCAGPGFIGFSLLANNLCEKLTLTDVNPEAVELCKETVKNNNLESRVSVYASDCLDNIPEAEKWDLVVGNPPHWVCVDENERQKDILSFDPNLEIHRKFYQDIKKFLKPSGSVLLQENKKATSIGDFREMIEGNGLKIIDVFQYTPPHEQEKNKILPKSVFSSCWKIFNPYRVFRYLKRRGGHHRKGYYFIWCKLK